jgi:putative endonuclease
VKKGVIARRLSGVVAISRYGFVFWQSDKDMNKQYYVYIMTNKNNSILYTGVTNNLKRRVFEHKNKLVEGFTKKYNIDKLVFYEVYNDINDAITREKQIKSGSRAKKIKLIEEMNSRWNGMYDEI